MAICTIHDLVFYLERGDDRGHIMWFLFHCLQNFILFFYISIEFSTCYGTVFCGKKETYRAGVVQVKAYGSLNSYKFS